MKKNEPNINVFNRQRALAVDIPSLRRFIRRLSDHLSVRAGFSVVLLRDETIRRYNRQFRGQDYPTDVLSFPAGPEWDGVQTEDYLGDILISIEAAERQKRVNLSSEIEILCIHGLLHLMGYDHETDRGEMRRLETKVKKELQLR